MKKTYDWAVDTVSLLASMSLIKVLFFYIYTAQTLKLSNIIGTIVWYFFLLITFRVLFKGRFFLLYCIVSCVLFIDFLYFQYFGFLPSVKELAHVHHIGGVKSSIIYVMDPLSFLFIIDLVPVGLYLRRKLSRAGETVEKSSGRAQWLAMFSILFLALVLPLISESLQPYFVFNRYGLFAYHLHDMAGLALGKIKAPIVDESVTYSGYINRVAEKGKYFALARNRNIILVQLESFQDFLVGFSYNGQEITPNLNRLISNNSIYFNEIYQQVGAGNTSDAEFVINNSMHGLGQISVYESRDQNSFYSLPALLNSKGFYTIAFHGNKGSFWNREKVYPSLGFDDFVSLEEMENDEIIGFGLSDLSFFRQVVTMIKSLPSPFFAFLVTLTSHNPYDIPGELHGIKLLPEHEGTLFGNYLQSVHYTDKALGVFISDLKHVGLYENSIVAIYGDHSGLYPFNKENRDIMTGVLGKTYDLVQAMNIPLVFHIPGSRLKVVSSIAGGQIDFFPTLLNLIGVVEKNEILFGRDLNNSSGGFVSLTHYVPEGSFIDDGRIFIMSGDGILENSIAIDRTTGETIPSFSCLDGYKDSIQQIEASKYLILNDSISQLLGQATSTNTN